MIIELIAIGVYVAEYVYHRLGEHPDPKPADRRFHIPRVDNGVPVGLIYGRTRVREPVLSYASAPSFHDVVGSISYGYQMNMLFTLGIPCESGTNVTHGMWVGESRMQWGLITNGFDDSTQTGDGEFETAILTESADLGGYRVHGAVETLNGKPTQTLIDDDGTERTAIGAELHTTLLANYISGYRGVMAAFLKNDSSSDQFSLGPDANIPSFSFEASSYRTVYGYSSIGYDANPVVVLYDLLTAYLGKGGISTSYIHDTSWHEAATRLGSEHHGYSDCLSTARPLAEHVVEILRQIDAVIYEDPSDGLLHLKLVRPDYSAASLLEINKSNCTDLVNFVMGGQQGRTNRVRVIYSSRDHDYNERDEVAYNMANAAGQDGIVNESVLRFPGVTTSDLASAIAHRELAWSCRPMIKFRAILDRSWYGTVPGDVVRVNWTNPDVSNLVMRVGRVDRGTLSDGKIALDLIQDNSYVPPRVPNAQPGGGPREILLEIPGRTRT